MAKVIGRKHFHVRYIKLSYRIRGNDARIHTKVVATVIVIDIVRIFWVQAMVPVNRVAVNRLIRRIFAYSAIKMSANVDLLYSVLNPDTSSDSPSARSKGVRFVSAKFVINHNIAMGNNINVVHEVILIFMYVKFIDLCVKRMVSKIRDMDTSYEIVWAILRKDPRRAYFEFEHHPAMNVEYTFILDTHRKYSTLNIKINEGYECG
jgi:hypothetical protein